jgi:hypothetical protein
MGIGLTGANMPMPEMLRDGWQSFLNYRNMYEYQYTTSLTLPLTILTTISETN